MRPRAYSAWLGGKDNYPVDQEAAELTDAADPAIVPAVHAGRALLGRAVRGLSGKAGLPSSSTSPPRGNAPEEISRSGCSVATGQWPLPVLR
ncbi:SAM-dependent methyltransferase [Streptomyces sp. MBT53]|uniref:SAM-dependent methyltransferase n=1 Tax=Streptomyces sp. MBT53 TaxID=1488384 RepID=UPI001914C947|nr:SAM-dependent methyltransferase [Streptomyces sp. MBT53]